MYLIDGYNLLFRIEESKLPLEKRRDALIAILAEELRPFQFSAAVVFDGEDPVCKYASRTFFEDLEVIYTHTGQTADEFIIEMVEISSNPSLLTVISSDEGLKRQCAHLGAKTLSIESFITMLAKKRARSNREPTKPCHDPDIERLRKIFEKKLESD
ncbi:MAG: hypothetical protein K940chlam2_00323 [Chlamydiae bacterium]|nr:hypothetical protein [Chlamydiota bacterium]